jgi:cobalamin biosynthesis Mg chelatase CobN
VLLLSIWFLPAAAWADSATIVLKSGEVMEAEILSLEVSKQVTVRDDHGVEISIPWEQIEKLQMQGDKSAGSAAQAPAPSSPALAAGAEPASAAGQAAATTAGPAASTTAAADAGAPTTATAASSEQPSPVEATTISLLRLQLLERQIEEKNEQMPSIAGPIVFMSVGGGLATVFFVAAGDSVNSGYSGESAPYFSLAGVFTAMAVVGVIWMGEQMKARKRKRVELEPLEAERKRLLLEVQPAARGAVGVMTMQF